jgi:hypothetical protein
LHIEEIFLIHVLSELAFNTVKNFLPSQAALGGERTKSWRYMSIPAKCGPTSVFHLPESHFFNTRVATLVTTTVLRQDPHLCRSIGQDEKAMSIDAGWGVA